MIPDEAVEAAAKATFQSERGWEDLGDTYKAAALVQARAALEAAAPYLLAEERAAAWGLGMWTMQHTTNGEYPAIPEQNPFRSAA